MDELLGPSESPARRLGGAGLSISWTRIARRIRVPMGFVFALFFLLTAHPSVHSLLWSLLGTVPGVALRAYASGYVTKNTELTTTGPYAYTRNPLYLGSMLIAFGFAVAAHSWWIALALAVLFALIYLPTIRSEEEFLRGQFSDYDEYMRRVPRLLPRLTPASTIESACNGSAASPARSIASTASTMRPWAPLLSMRCCC